jgi:hypothetical protein
MPLGEPHSCLADASWVALPGCGHNSNACRSLTSPQLFSSREATPSSHHAKTGTAFARASFANTSFHFNREPHVASRACVRHECPLETGTISGNTLFFACYCLFMAMENSPALEGKNSRSLCY